MDHSLTYPPSTASAAPPVSGPLADNVRMHTRTPRSP